MKCQVIISQLQALKEEALKSKMDEVTATQKIKKAIELVSPLPKLCIEQPMSSKDLLFVREFDRFVNKTHETVDRIINRTSDLLFFCNTVFRMVETYSEADPGS